MKDTLNINQAKSFKKYTDASLIPPRKFVPIGQNMLRDSAAKTIALP